MKAKLTNQELFYFCEQFSILLHSGISCAEGIQLMLEDSHTQKGRDFSSPSRQIMKKTVPFIFLSTIPGFFLTL